MVVMAAGQHACIQCTLNGLGYYMYFTAFLLMRKEIRWLNLLFPQSKKKIKIKIK